MKKLHKQISLDQLRIGRVNPFFNFRRYRLVFEGCQMSKVGIILEYDVAEQLITTHKLQTYLSYSIVTTKVIFIFTEKHFAKN